MRTLAFMKCLWFLIACSFCQGCVSGSGYWTNRGRDAADVFTLTVGKGFGATARVGPTHVGLFFGFDRVGFRGGELKTQWADNSAFGWAGLVDPLIVLPPIERKFLTGEEAFRGQIEQKLCLAELRGKAFLARGVCPFFMMPSSEEYRWEKYPYYYWSQIEVGAGLGLIIRAGFNPGELLDLLLGWFCIDIYGDDVGIVSKKKPPP